MNTEQLLLIIGGLLISIVGYFLVKTMDKLNTTTDKTDKNTGDIALLKQETTASIILLKSETGSKHERLEEKMDELKESIVELTDEIKTLNKRP